jgi:hypothetical protein
MGSHAVMHGPNPKDVLDQLHEALGAFYAGGEAEPVRKLLSADVEWHVPGRNSIAGDYYGAQRRARLLQETT